MFAMFGADWCPYSSQLKPIFKDAAADYKLRNPTADVIWASVDCDDQQDICERFYVNKYPTMKLFVFGDMMINEYRGERAMRSLCDFVDEHYNDAINIFNDDPRQDLDKEKGNVIAYIRRGSEAYKNLHVSYIPRCSCKYQSSVRDRYMVTIFKFIGNLEDYAKLKQWISDKCIPVVREVTFKNVEGLTEEGLPFLVFFRDPAKKEDEKIFVDAVIRELYDTRMTINPLLADGNVFSHPLRHLGKTSKDLPVLAIDSFTHMYLFPNVSQLATPGVLKQFVEDLHSGVLHQRFHGKPEIRRQKISKFLDKQNTGEDHQAAQDPPESVFKELRPSGKRYSFLQKTEL
ncbi:unnamed protein product [Haemonchus placei]|uniref:Thioredoxin domain-containing protein n=1 Tax=Haemonchus placei TaxID=6290 RepID=A0A158QLB5_HAEPC|nr:unnamed protein product [Haemonchus placei]